MPNAPKHVAAYIRVSRIGGRTGDGYISPTIQRERLAAFAETINVTVPDDAWYSDEDYTGGNVDRPAFQEAIARIGRDLDGLIVVRIDRFSRSVEDGVAMVDRITSAGGMFASATEHIDVRDPVGRYVLVNMLNNAELALGMLKRGWSDAKAKAVRRGVHIGPTPFGYQRTPKGQPDAGKLFPDPDTGPVVTELFDTVAKGHGGWGEITRWMQARHPRDRGWQAHRVKAMLARRVYLGEVHYRSRVEGVDDLVNPDAHEPLTDLATFDRANAHIVAGARREAHTDFLLSGLLKCANCRGAMGGWTYGGKDRKTPIYRCSNSKDCTERPVVTARLADDYVKATVREIIAARARTLKDAAAEDTVGPELDARALSADTEVRRYVADTEIRELLGDTAWREGLVARQVALTRAREDQALHDAHRPLDHAAREDVTEWADDQYRDYLRRMTQAIFIRKAPRGTPIAERVKLIGASAPPIPVHHRGSRHGVLPPLDWDDPHDTAGSPSHHPSGDSA
jgi:DNA invertase Pin-like site-specific DNA recombinase